LQKRLEKSLNLYMQQRWDWEEIQDDIKDRTLDTSERRSVDQNQWTLENSVIDVELQDIAISQAHMSAPFAGILVFSPVSTAYTQVTSADYFELIDPDSLILRAEVNEEDVPLIELGQTATIELDAYPKDSIQTQLSYIAYQSNLTASGTVYAIELPIALDTIKMQYGEGISLLNRFRLGMNGDVKIVLEKKNNVLTVPLICIKMSDDQYLVEIMTKDGKVVDQPVEIGLETDELVEIVSGLTTADQVVLPSLK
ncbi:MAG TPA: efflux RND transporter periplasmic adaptor subunit, partial [Candidatus Woesebacteria bacterium]|nr:efflux RND transporter periplasmic adaptor subunit [Candidatus Woesebacteria bacterium]